MNVQPSPFTPPPSPEPEVDNENATYLNITVINAISKTVIPFDSSVSRGTLAEIVIYNSNPHTVRVVIHGALVNNPNSAFHKSTFDLNNGEATRTSQFAIMDDCSLFFLSSALPLEPGRDLYYTAKNIKVLSSGADS